MVTKQLSWCPLSGCWLSLWWKHDCMLNEIQCCPFGQVFFWLLWCVRRDLISPLPCSEGNLAFGFSSPTLSYSAVLLCPRWVTLLMSESTVRVWINLVSSCVPIQPSNLGVSHAQTTSQNINWMCPVWKRVFVFGTHLAGVLHWNEIPYSGTLNLDIVSRNLFAKRQSVVWVHNELSNFSVGTTIWTATHNRVNRLKAVWL